MNNKILPYDEVWEKVIKRSIRLCEKQLDTTFKDESKFSVCNLNDYKLQLKKIYRRKRQWLKKVYLPNDGDATLDFHKLSAALCRSIIGLKPFKYDMPIAERLFVEVKKKTDCSQKERISWQVNNSYINYKLAFLVAEGMIYIDLLYWAKCMIEDLEKDCNSVDYSQEKNDNLKKELRIYQQIIDMLQSSCCRLCHYQETPSHDDFFISSVIALMKNDYLERNFDYLQFSISMFQWEEYTKKQLYEQALKSINGE